MKWIFTCLCIHFKPKPRLQIYLDQLAYINLNSFFVENVDLSFVLFSCRERARPTTHSVWLVPASRIPLQTYKSLHVYLAHYPKHPQRYTRVRQAVVPPPFRGDGWSLHDGRTETLPGEMLRGAEGGKTRMRLYFPVVGMGRWNCVDGASLEALKVSWCNCSRVQRGLLKRAHIMLNIDAGRLLRIEKGQNQWVSPISTHNNSQWRS